MNRPKPTRPTGVPEATALTIDIQAAMALLDGEKVLYASSSPIKPSSVDVYLCRRRRLSSDPVAPPSGEA